MWGKFVLIMVTFALNSIIIYSILVNQYADDNDNSSSLLVRKDSLLNPHLASSLDDKIAKLPDYNTIHQWDRYFKIQTVVDGSNSDKANISTEAPVITIRGEYSTGTSWIREVITHNCPTVVSKTNIEVLNADALYGKLISIYECGSMEFIFAFILIMN